MYMRTCTLFDLTISWLKSRGISAKSEMFYVVPFECFIFRNKLLVFLPVKYFFFNSVFIFIQLQRICVDPFTSRTAVEFLKRVPLNAISTLWAAYFKILSKIDIIDITNKTPPSMVATPKEYSHILVAIVLSCNPRTTQLHSFCPSKAFVRSPLLPTSF